MPTALTLTRAEPGRGSGVERSTTSRVPLSFQTAALMAAPRAQIFFREGLQNATGWLRTQATQRTMRDVDAASTSNACLDAAAAGDHYRSVHFGIFVEELRHGASQMSAFRDIFDAADRAEALGIDCVWLGEIHFTPARSVISASL